MARTAVKKTKGKQVFGIRVRKAGSKSTEATANGQGMDDEILF